MRVVDAELGELVSVRLNAKGNTVVRWHPDILGDVRAVEAILHVLEESVSQMSRQNGACN